MNKTNKQIYSIQNKSLELMIGIDNYLKKHQINYMISAGTALGAVRHGGFIPWDDDVDFDMHIEDMVKLYKISRKDVAFQKDYFLQNKWTDPNVPEQFWRIRMNGTTMMDQEGMIIKMHWGLPIDIFPVYNAPNSRFLRRVMVYANGRMNKYSRIPFIRPEESSLKKWIATLIYKMLFLILLIISRTSKNNNFLYYPTGHGSVDNRFIKRDVYFPNEKILFEGHAFSCHHDIKRYLEITYGDYMTLPPPEMQKSHECFLVDMDKDYSEYVAY